MVYKERKFSLLYDNRRRIVESKRNLFGPKLLDSAPLNDIEEGLYLRGVSKFFTSVSYNKNSKGAGSKTYKTALDSAILTFIKGLIAKEPMFGLLEHQEDLSDYKDIVKFIKDFDPTKSISVSSISHLKHRRIL